MPYSGDPADSSLDAVRFLIQDTSTSPFFADAEINYTIGLYPTVMLAASALCDQAIIATQSLSTSAGVSEKQVGDLRIKYDVGSGGTAERWRNIKASLRAQAARLSGTAYTGGASVADKANVEADTDGVDAKFRRGSMSYPDQVDEKILDWNQ